MTLLVFFFVFRLCTGNYSNDVDTIPRKVPPIPPLPPIAAVVSTSTAVKTAFLQELQSAGSFFSYHRCVGWDNTKTAWKKRTCHLKNVCYLRETADWHYVNRHGSAVRADDLSVSLSPLKRVAGGGSSGKQFSIKSVPATAATDLIYPRLPRKTGVHILYESYNAENFGHFLGDELLPLYQAADLFGFANQLNDVQMMRWIDDEPHNIACTMVDDKSKCEANYNALFPLLSKRPLQRMTADNASFCVTDLIVGVGMLTDHCADLTGHGRWRDTEPNCNHGLAQQFWRFRGHLVSNARSLRRARARRVRALRGNVTTAAIVVCTRRTGNKLYRLPSNYEEVMRQVAATLNQTIALVDMASLPIDEQIRLVSHAKLLASPAGGASFIGLFLPKGAAMIAFSDKKHDRQLDFGFFTALSHIEVTYVLTRKREAVRLRDMQYMVQRILANADVFGNNGVVDIVNNGSVAAATAMEAAVAVAEQR